METSFFGRNEYGNKEGSREDRWNKDGNHSQKFSNTERRLC